MDFVTVISDFPEGILWGWSSNLEARFHLETSDHKHKVYLEDKGKRCFQPTGTSTLEDFRAFYETVRSVVESRWVHEMIKRGWLQLEVNLPEITLGAYSSGLSLFQNDHAFKKLIDLRNYLPDASTVKSVNLDQRFGALLLEYSSSELKTVLSIENLLWD